MKEKFIEKAMLVWIIGFIALAADLAYMSVNLTKLNIVVYLLCIGVIPVLILFAVSFIYACISVNSKRTRYIIAVAAAIVFALIALLVCNSFISQEVIDQLINNSKVSGNMEVSVRMGNSGDTIQSFLVFIAFSGIGCFLGNTVRTKMLSKPGSGANEVKTESEYD